MKLCHAAILMGVAIARCCIAADQSWSKDLSDPKPGSFAKVIDFKAEYHFGWSNVLEAGRADVSIRRDGDDLLMDVRGKSLGLARTLWRMDAKHHAIIDGSSLRAREFSQHETYRNRTIETKVRFGLGRLERFRRISIDPPEKARWKSVEIDPVFDILGGAMFVRSRPLNTGDKIALIAFPGDSPYRVDAKVHGRETLEVMQQSRRAIRIDLKIQKVEVESKKPVGLSKHRKFRSGRVWVSDDEFRIPLRAEVQIFIGFVYGELTAFEPIQ